MPKPPWVVKQLSTSNKFPLTDQVHLVNVVKPQVILFYLAMFTYLPSQCTLLRGPLLHFPSWSHHDRAKCNPPRLDTSCRLPPKEPNLRIHLWKFKTGGWEFKTSILSSWSTCHTLDWLLLASPKSLSQLLWYFWETINCCMFFIASPVIAFFTVGVKYLL